MMSNADSRFRGMAETDESWDTDDKFLDDIKKEPTETSRCRYRRILKQVVMVVCVCQAFLTIGMMASWPNPAVADLRISNTTIYGTQIHLQPTEEDMLGSIVSFGSIPGTLVGGVLVARLGRRHTMISLFLPALLGWGLIALAPIPSVMLAGRFFNGMSCGLTTVAGTTYIVELSDTNIRGAMSVLPTVFIILGFIFTVSLGFALRWFQIPFVSLGVSFLCMISMLFLPESPSYLAVHNKEDQARKILAELRGPDADIEEELKVLKDKNRVVQSHSLFSVVRQPDILKSLAIVVSLFFVHNFCGLPLIIVNATRIFHTSGTSIDERVATLLIFLAQFIGVCSSIYLIDYIGRRWCLIISLTITALCQIVFGTYMYCKHIEENSQNVIPEHMSLIDTNTSLITIFGNTSETIINNTTLTPTVVEKLGWTDQYSWVPVMCLLIFMLGASVGIMSVPFILAYEYFPTTVRSQMSSICILVSSAFNMTILALFTPMQTALTPAGLYWFCSGVCVFGIIISFAFVRETKGEHVG